MPPLLRNLVVSTLLGAVIGFIGFLLQPPWQPPFRTEQRVVHANEPIPMIETTR